MKSIRWVGFDMDECLGALYPLYSYCEHLLENIDNTTTRNAFYTDMIEAVSEESFMNPNSSLWLFRPDFANVLRLLIQAYTHGQIVGCFILSNNGSASLVNTARLLLNSGAAKLSNYTVTDLFKESWSAYAPCRKGSLIKSWAVIQTCLVTARLPRMNNSKTDLLFFDDKLHTSLRNDLGSNYIQVTPYFNYTPHTNVSRILDPLYDKYQIGRSIKMKIKKLSENIEREDLQLIFQDTPNHKEESYSLKNPSPRIRQQISEFMEPLTRFISVSPKTRKPSIQRTIRSQKATVKTPISKFTTKNSVKRRTIWKRY